MIKDVYTLKQDSTPVREYYTMMRGIGGIGYNEWFAKNTTTAADVFSYTGQKIRRNKSGSNYNTSSKN